MSRRKTFRVHSRKSEKRLHLRVSSPRIVCFRFLRSLKSGGRLALVLGLLGTAGWGAKAGLRSFFIENEEFQLSEVELETNGAFTERDFAEVTGIDPTSSVFAIKLAELRAKLEAFPCVISATLSRRLPGTLRVNVEERVPVAWVECPPLGIVGKDPKSGLLVDGRGVCFPCESWWVETAQSLPVILVSQADEGDVTVGKELRHHEARRALELIKLSRERLAGQQLSLPVVAVCNDYSLVAATSTGALATFGMYEHERQIGDLITIEARTRTAGRTMVAVNLIPARNIPVKFGTARRAGEGDGEGDGRGEGEGFQPGNRLERDIRAILNRS